MVSYKLEDGREISHAGDCSEFTFAQLCDIKEHLQAYDNAIKDEKNLDAYDHLRAALNLCVDGDISDLQIMSSVEDELSLTRLLIAVANAARLIPDVDDIVTYCVDGVDYTFNKIDYEQYGGTTEQFVEAACLEAYMPDDPFSCSEDTASFYSITLQQLALVFKSKDEKQLSTLTPRDRDNWIIEKAKTLQDMPAHYAQHTRASILGFMNAYRKWREPISATSLT